MPVIEVRQTEIFARWLTNLRDGRARARINARIRRLSIGNTGDTKSVGGGVSEMRIDYGPGYRVYFVHRGEALSYYSRAETSERKLTISPWL